MSRVWVGYGSTSRGCGDWWKLGAGGVAADWSSAASLPRGVGTSGKMIKRNSASLDRFHRFHTAAVSTALVFRADSCLRRRDAQTESMDRGEEIRDRNGDGAGEGIHFGNSEEASGFGRVDTSVAGAVFRGRKSCAGHGRGRQVPEPDRGAQRTDRRASACDRRAVGGDTILKKTLEGVHLSWSEVEQARSEVSLSVVRATQLLDLCRTTYYRRVRGMTDYQRQGRCSPSAKHNATLRCVAWNGLRRATATFANMRYP